MCNKCTERFTVRADYEQFHTINQPSWYAMVLSHSSPFSPLFLPLPSPLYLSSPLSLPLTLPLHPLPIPSSPSCPTNICNSLKFSQVEGEEGSHIYQDYQEIKLQEQTQHLEVGTISTPALPSPLFIPINAPPISSICTLDCPPPLTSPTACGLCWRMTWLTVVNQEMMSPLRKILC